MTTSISKLAAALADRYTIERELGAGGMWDVAPGDQRFLMLRLISSDTPSELIVVENFFEELKAKVKR